MSLKNIGLIEIPNSAAVRLITVLSIPSTRRVFVAHTRRGCVEVIDHDARKHIKTLPGFPEAASVVADAGTILVTNRGAASLACVDALSFETRAVFKTGPRPNGVAIAAKHGLGRRGCYWR